jgi:hypothetical protein
MWTLHNAFNNSSFATLLIYNCLLAKDWYKINNYIYGATYNINFDTNLKNSFHKFVIVNTKWEYKNITNKKTN